MRRNAPRGKNPRQVSDLLETGAPGLGQLLARAREIGRLDGVVASLLEPDLAARIRVATLREGILVLVTPSAALATRLRMEAPHVVKALHGRGERSIREIAVRVAPLPARADSPLARRPLPAAALRALERFAEDSGDEELRAIIARSERAKTRE